MKEIHAVYENGVFRPTEPVDLPEGCEVILEPRQARTGEPPDDRLRRIYALLAESFDTGDSDLAARHDEHQP
jgi:predicted DNA-binding antitoxin AbrB/MazE fold protein